MWQVVRILWLPEANYPMNSDSQIWSFRRGWMKVALLSNASLEKQLRTDDSLKIRLFHLIQHHDQGARSVGKFVGGCD